ncbi:MAG: response regulator [Candidatus Pacebacteria bacterium]|nr:response regulator [Candidatus Paceibacterota bacterium]
MPEQDHDQPTPSHTILIAEDDAFLSRVLVDKLEKAHFQVITAFDGEEALKKLSEGSVHLMILDIIMPKKMGFDVLDEAKSNPATKNIPILVLSNLGQDGDIEMAVKKGASGYFVKSNISLVSVVEKVRECLAIT